MHRAKCEQRGQARRVTGADYALTRADRANASVLQNARRVAARRAPPPRGGSTFSDILIFPRASLVSTLVSLMGRRQVLWAQRARQKLIQRLGWTCSDCGTCVHIEV